ncbi:MAG TPA: hypothetical protein VG148_02990 [Pyrinomonadaceae bacterium]|nr:hypothetical protein [Pyrinomonadaceae bacterium]
MNHGLIDPALVFAALPRRISFPDWFSHTPKILLVSHKVAV